MTTVHQAGGVYTGTRREGKNEVHDLVLKARAGTITHEQRTKLNEYKERFPGLREKIEKALHVANEKQRNATPPQDQPTYIINENPTIDLSLIIKNEIKPDFNEIIDSLPKENLIKDIIPKLDLTNFGGAADRLGTELYTDHKLEKEYPKFKPLPKPRYELIIDEPSPEIFQAVDKRGPITLKPLNYNNVPPPHPRKFYDFNNIIRLKSSIPTVERIKQTTFVTGDNVEITSVEASRDNSTLTFSLTVDGANQDPIVHTPNENLFITTDNLTLSDGDRATINAFAAANGKKSDDVLFKLLRTVPTEAVDHLDYTSEIPLFRPEKKEPLPPD